MDLFSIEKVKRVLIVGASGALGESLCLEIKKSNPKAFIVGTYTNKIPKYVDEGQFLDFTDDSSIEKFLRNMNTKFELILFCQGVLKVGESTPEKTAKKINPLEFKKVFDINFFGPAFILSQFDKLIDKKNKTMVVVLSAMVGSISENKIGGWYSYRCSKTALNMYIKNLQIELKRLHYNCMCMAIHPGTTHSNLSQKFLSNVKHKIWTPEGSAKNILHIIQTKYANEECFFNWDGRVIKW